MRCTTYSTAMKLIGCSVHAAGHERRRPLTPLRDKAGAASAQQRRTSPNTSTALIAWMAMFVDFIAAGSDSR